MILFQILPISIIDRCTQFCRFLLKTKHSFEASYHISDKVYSAGNVKGLLHQCCFLSFPHFKLAHPRVMTTEAQVSSCCDFLCKTLKLVSNSQQSLSCVQNFLDGWSTYLCSARTNWHLFLKILSMQSIFCQADDNMDFSFPFSNLYWTHEIEPRQSTACCLHRRTCKKQDSIH